MQYMHLVYIHNHKAKKFLINELIEIANAMNNTTTINTFNSDYSIIAESGTSSSNHDNHYKQNIKI